MATTTSLSFRILSSYDGSGVAAARASIAGLNNDLDRHSGVLRAAGRGLGLFASALGDAGRRIPMIAVAATALAAALTPVGIVATGAAAGLVTLAAGAALAAAPFIGLAVTAASNAEKMGTAGKKYMTALDGVKTSWMNLARETAPLTLTPMTTVLDGLNKAIPKLKPLIQDLAPVFQDLANATSKWLTGAGFERFLSTLRKDGVPALKNLIDAGRSFSGVLGKAFRDFMPLAKDISKAIADGAANLKKWADDGGFQRFVDKVRKNWPAVRDFLKEAGEFAGKLGQVLQDWGPEILGFGTGLLDFLNKLDIDALKDLILALGALRLAAGGLSALGGLASLLAALRGGGQIAGVAGLSAAAAALGVSAAALSAAAAALSAAAAALSGAATALAGAAAGGLIADILGNIFGGGGGGTATFSVNVQGADEATAQLTQLSDLFATIQALGSAILIVELSSTTFVTDLTNIATKWQEVLTLAGTPATFHVLLNLLGFGISIAIATIAWAAFVAFALATPAIFRAAVNTAALLAGIASANLTWALFVLFAAATPATFTVHLSTGSFTAAVGAIVAAWARVTGLTKSVTFTANLSASQVVSASAQIVSAWQRVLGMTRSVTFRASLSSGAFVSAANAIVSAWQRVLAMPRSVTFTVNIVGGSAVGGIVPPTGGNIDVRVPDLFVTIPPAFPSGVEPKFPFQPDGMAHGGMISGPGGPMSDQVPMMLSSGEFVIRAASVKRLGVDFLNHINAAGSFSGGRMSGLVEGGGTGEMMVTTSATGDTYHLHLEGGVHTRSDQEFRDILVEALTTLKRRERLP